MTEHSDFKHVVRERAAKTGESYQAARRQLERQRGRFSARAVDAFHKPSGKILGCIIEGGEVTLGMRVTVTTGDGATHEGVVVNLRHVWDDLESVRYGGPYGEFGLLIEPAYVGPLPAQVTG
jgi:translation initiation factor IF-2